MPTEKVLVKLTFVDYAIKRLSEIYPGRHFEKQLHVYLSSQPGVQKNWYIIQSSVIDIVETEVQQDISLWRRFFLRLTRQDLPTEIVSKEIRKEVHDICVCTDGVIINNDYDFASVYPETLSVEVETDYPQYLDVLSQIMDEYEAKMSEDTREKSFTLTLNIKPDLNIRNELQDYDDDSHAHLEDKLK